MVICYIVLRDVIGKELKHYKAYKKAHYIKSNHNLMSSRYCSLFFLIKDKNKTKKKKNRNENKR